MKLPLIRLGETIDALENMKGDAAIAPPLRYRLNCIYTTLRQSADALSPLLTGEWENDKWIEGYESLEFTGLNYKELDQFPDMTPNQFRVLLRLTTN